MGLTWLSFCWIKATQCTVSSGGVHHSTLAEYLICMMIQSLTDKARWSFTMETSLTATVLSRLSMTPNQQRFTILELSLMSKYHLTWPSTLQRWMVLVLSGRTMMTKIILDSNKIYLPGYWMPLELVVSLTVLGKQIFKFCISQNTSYSKKILKRNSVELFHQPFHNAVM